MSPTELMLLIDAATALTLTVTVAEDCVVSAGRIVAEYFQNPVSEKPSDLKPDVFNNLIPLSSPAFDDVVAYFGQELRCKPLPFYLPNFGDGVFRSLVWRNGKNPVMVAMAIECSRRAKPLSPRVAMNLLAVQRATDPETAQLLHKAVTNTWRRGLLIPGVSDVGQLDWGAELSQIPPLVTALRELADKGMLAVVWDVFDQLLGRIATMQRLPAGTLEIVTACEYYLPTVPNEARTLPGLRLFAQRAGKSEAVRLAQQVVAQLPAADVPTGGRVDKQEAGERFERIWPTSAGTKPHTDDGVRISAYTRNPQEEITLTVPGIEHPITVAQCNPTSLTCLKQGRKGSLYTDGTQVLFSPWARKSTTQSNDSPPFVSLVLLAQLGLGATDNPWRHYRNQLCGATSIRIFVEQLLHFPDFRPDMCLKAITGNPETLPWLWPVITVALTHAAACTTPPVWAARVLTFACEHAPILAEATRRGHIPATEWDSLDTLAAMSKKCAAKTKAQQLHTFFNNQMGQP
ncbi:hypothetical protein [Corynebacterium mustelae]|nr:hypothetical protein [Corynebacterium mustelae]